MSNKLMEQIKQQQQEKLKDNVNQEKEKVG